MDKNFWENAQAAEAKFWGRCINTFGEEKKQLEIYAPRMRINFDLAGKSVLDIGSGPTSMLLKCHNFKKAKAIDPMPMPQWVKDRYLAAGIEFVQQRGETIVLPREVFDEVWIYNVLQHTEEPRAIIENAKNSGRLIRIFEWVDVPPDVAHPHVLKKDLLDEWLGKKGMTEQITDHASFTNAYYNVIKL